MILDLSLEILLTNIHKKYLSRIENEIGGFRILSMSKMEFLQQPLTVFAKSSILEGLFARLPKICF